MRVYAGSELHVSSVLNHLEADQMNPNTSGNTITTIAAHTA
jgi:hypothetical protein